MTYTLRQIAKDAITGKLVLSEDELKTERMKICSVCEHFQPALRKCDICGCFMEIKSRILQAECPINKW